MCGSNNRSGEAGTRSRAHAPGWERGTDQPGSCPRTTEGEQTETLPTREGACVCLPACMWVSTRTAGHVYTHVCVRVCCVCLPVCFHHVCVCVPMCRMQHTDELVSNKAVGPECQGEEGEVSRKGLLCDQHSVPWPHAEQDRLEDGPGAREWGRPAESGAWRSTSCGVSSCEPARGRQAGQGPGLRPCSPPHLWPEAPSTEPTSQARGQGPHDLAWATSGLPS